MPWKLLLLCSLLCFGPRSQSAERPPNIVFIFADDLGINDLSCYGRKEHHTPSLDRLAAEGIRFTSAYCAQPICSPSRAALLTGKAPGRLHLTTFLPGRADAPSQKVLHPRITQALPLEEKTIAEYLKEAGYATACIGKWHLGGKGFLPPDQGFDLYHPGKANTTPTESEGGKGEFDLTAKAEEFMTQNREKPFFLYLPHNTPHIPYSSQTNLVKKHADAFEPVYAALMESMDLSVGRLLKKIDDLDLAKNTLVIFTSDNGGLHVPELRHEKITYNAPFRAGKGYLYEGGTRIPLIVRWPGKIKPGQVLDTPVINTDWLPTFLTLVGVRPGSPLDGVDIAPLLLESKPPEPRRLFWHFPHYTNQGGRPGGAVRDGNWKFIEFYDTGETELYDLSTDISESKNLANTQSSRATELRAALTRWRTEIGAQENTPNPSFKPELFKQLYVETDPSKYQPEKADRAMFKRMLGWRKLMDAVVR